jgi:cyclohexyl-isocyanide hydratase
MRIAYILYDDLTLLDFIGFYDPISRLRSLNILPDLGWDYCALTPTVRDTFGLTLAVDRTRPDLSDYDLAFVPGGVGSRVLMHDPVFLDWLRTARSVPLKVSVCTGSLLLGAAGLIRRRRATTHFGEYDRLSPYVGEVVRNRIVEDGDLITGGAVASSLDVGLYVVDKLAGPRDAELIRRAMNYGR